MNKQDESVDSCKSYSVKSFQQSSNNIKVVGNSNNMKQLQFFEIPNLELNVSKIKFKRPQKIYDKSRTNSEKHLINIKEDEIQNSVNECRFVALESQQTEITEKTNHRQTRSCYNDLNLNQDQLINKKKVVSENDSQLVKLCNKLQLRQHGIATLPFIKENEINKEGRNGNITNSTFQEICQLVKVPLSVEPKSCSESDNLRNSFEKTIDLFSNQLHKKSQNFIEDESLQACFCAEIRKEKAKDQMILVDQECQTDISCWLYKDFQLFSLDKVGNHHNPVQVNNKEINPLQPLNSTKLTLMNENISVSKPQNTLYDSEMFGGDLVQNDCLLSSSANRQETQPNYSHKNLSSDSSFFKIPYQVPVDFTSSDNQLRSICPVEKASSLGIGTKGDLRTDDLNCVQSTYVSSFGSNSGISTGSLSEVSEPLLNKLTSKICEDIKMCLIEDEEHNIALHHAVMENDLRKLKRQCIVLHAIKHHVNNVNSAKETALTLAVKLLGEAKNPDIRAVSLLLSEGADQKIADNDGRTPLHHAVKYCRKDIVKLLLNENDAVKSLQKYDTNGLTPLHLAAMEDNSKIVKMLIKRGADVNVKDRKSGRTPYFIASTMGNSGAMKTLKKFHARTSERNFAGQLPWLSKSVQSCVLKDQSILPIRKSPSKRKNQVEKEEFKRKKEKYHHNQNITSVANSNSNNSGSDSSERSETHLNLLSTNISFPFLSNNLNISSSTRNMVDSQPSCESKGSETPSRITNGNNVDVGHSKTNTSNVYLNVSISNLETLALTHENDLTIPIGKETSLSLSRQFEPNNQTNYKSTLTEKEANTFSDTQTETVNISAQETLLYPPSNSLLKLQNKISIPSGDNYPKHEQKYNTLFSVQPKPNVMVVLPSHNYGKDLDLPDAKIIKTTPENSIVLLKQNPQKQIRVRNKRPVKALKSSVVENITSDTQPNSINERLSPSKVNLTDLCSKKIKLGKKNEGNFNKLLVKGTSDMPQNIDLSNLVVKNISGPLKKLSFASNNLKTVTGRIENHSQVFQQKISFNRCLKKITMPVIISDSQNAVKKYNSRTIFITKKTGERKEDNNVF